MIDIKRPLVLHTATFFFTMMLPLAAFACAENHQGISKEGHPHTCPTLHTGADAKEGGGGVSDFQRKNNIAMLDMHNHMANVTFMDNNEVDFMALMIPHHEGAIRMAEIILNTSVDIEVRNLAQGIITEQKNEINIMKHLIEARKK